MARARRRATAGELLAQAILGGCLVAAGGVSILIAGTQLLDPYWLAPLSVVGAGLALWRTSRRAPAGYRVAQLVDERLALNDALSTAFHFLDREDAVAAMQRERAQRLAQGIQVSDAIPLRAPRSAWALAAMAMLVAGLFTLRFGLERRLDLRAPLTRVLADTFSAEPQRVAGKKKNARLPWDQPVSSGMAVEEANAEERAKLDEASENALDLVDVPDVNNETGGVERKEGTPNGKGGGNEPGSEETEEGEAAETGSDAATGQRASEGDQPKSGKQSDGGGKETPGTSGENSSLAAKFKDAMANLMSRMKPPAATGARNANQKGGPQADTQSASAAQKGTSAGKGESGGDAQGESKDGQPGAEAEGQNADGQASGASADQQESNNPGSGMGKQDGLKDVKLAEQLAAMGKISEIIGKRSANVTGEVTVEVQNTKQQLKTPYSQSRATHGETSGEVNRDEVPAALQDYVQQYFER
ncbi:MAG: hypothetical protein ACRD96_20260, partial [Bryobacteraceae bacterium]